MAKLHIPGRAELDMDGRAILDVANGGQADAVNRKYVDDAIMNAGSSSVDDINIDDNILKVQNADDTFSGDGVIVDTSAANNGDNLISSKAVFDGLNTKVTKPSGTQSTGFGGHAVFVDDNGDTLDHGSERVHLKAAGAGVIINTSLDITNDGNITLADQATVDGVDVSTIPGLIDDKQDKLPNLHYGGVWTNGGTTSNPVYASETVDIIGIIGDQHVDHTFADVAAWKADADTNFEIGQYVSVESDTTIRFKVLTASEGFQENVEDGTQYYVQLSTGDEDVENLILATASDISRAGGRFPTTEAWQNNRFALKTDTSGVTIANLGAGTALDPTKIPGMVVYDQVNDRYTVENNGNAFGRFSPFNAYSATNKDRVLHDQVLYECISDVAASSTGANLYPSTDIFLSTQRPGSTQAGQTSTTHWEYIAGPIQEFNAGDNYLKGSEIEYEHLGNKQTYTTLFSINSADTTGILNTPERHSYRLPGELDEDFSGNTNIWYEHALGGFDGVGDHQSFDFPATFPGDGFFIPVGSIWNWNGQEWRFEGPDQSEDSHPIGTLYPVPSATFNGNSANIDPLTGVAAKHFPPNKYSGLWSETFGDARWSPFNIYLVGQVVSFNTGTTDTPVWKRYIRTGVDSEFRGATTPNKTPLLDNYNPKGGDDGNGEDVDGVLYWEEITSGGDNGIDVETSFPTSPSLGDEIFLDVSSTAFELPNDEGFRRPRGFYTFLQPSSDPDSHFWEQLSVSVVGQLFNNARVGDVIYLQYTHSSFNGGDNFAPGFYRAAGNTGDDNDTTWTSISGSGTTINSIGDIADVDITGAAEGDILQRHTYVKNGTSVTEWVNTQGLVSVQQNINQILNHQGSGSTITLSEDSFPGLDVLRNSVLFSNQDGEKTEDSFNTADEAPRFYANIGQMSLAYTGLTTTQIQEIQNLVGQDITFRHVDDGSITDQNINDANSFHFRVVDWIYRGTDTRRLDLLIRDSSQQAAFLAKYNWTQHGTTDNWFISTGTSDEQVTDLLAQISVAVYIPVEAGTTVTGQTVRNLDSVTGFSGNLEGVNIGGSVYNIPLTSTQLTANAQTIPTGCIAIVDDELQYYNVSGAAITGVTLTTDFSGSNWSIVGRDHVFVRSEDTAAWGSLATPDDSLGKNGNIAFNDQVATSVAMYHKSGGTWSSVTLATSGTPTDGWENTGGLLAPTLQPVTGGVTADINGNGGTINVSNVGQLVGHTGTGLAIQGVRTFNNAPANALEKVGLFLGVRGDAMDPAPMITIYETVSKDDGVLTAITVTPYVTQGVTHLFHAGIGFAEVTPGGERTIIAGRGIWSQTVLTDINAYDGSVNYINLIG